MNAEQCLSYAKARLAVGMKATDVFFATIILRLEYISTDDAPHLKHIKTSATDGRHVFYNPEYIESLTDPQTDGLLKHFAMHIACMHSLRMGARDGAAWNLATDLVVNELLAEADVFLPPGSPLPGEPPFNKHGPDHEAEWHYNEFPPGEPCGYEGVGDVLPSTGDPGEAERHAKHLLATANLAARQRGDLPGGIDRLVAKAVAPPVPRWQDELREFISSTAKNDYCWLHPNRKLMQQCIQAPGQYSEELGDIVLAFDTSGSVDEKQFKLFANEAQAVLEAYDCKATLIYCDCEIHRVQQWSTGDGDMAFKPVGGGGTSHVPVWQWLKDRDMAPVCVICLTDLATDFGNEPPYPVLWCCVTQFASEVPFGRVVVVKE